jgi:hypothetical protein
MPFLLEVNPGRYAIEAIATPLELGGFADLPSTECLVWPAESATAPTGNKRNRSAGAAQRATNTPSDHGDVACSNSSTASRPTTDPETSS